MPNIDNGTREVSISDAEIAARLIVLLDKLNCTHVLNEKFSNLVAQYGLCTDNEDNDGAQAAVEDIEHFICYPEDA